MMIDLPGRLRDLGLTLPPVPRPAAAYVPFVRVPGLVQVSGQLPMRDGAMQAFGPVPSMCTLEQAKEAAGLCALNALAVLDAALAGDWSTLRQVVRIGVFVASDASFEQQHLVANGASELLAAVLGEAGRHARASVGVPCLPLGAAVEVELTAAVTT